LDFQLEEKKIQLHWQILENKQSAQKYHDKLTAERDKGAWNMQYQLSKQKSEQKV
jgi:hypothetical protein